MSGPQPVTAEDLYLYAMELLEPEEQARLHAFLQQSPEARAELANVRADLALLAMTAEQQAPPALSRQRLLKSIAREKKTGESAVRTERQTTQHAIPSAALEEPVLHDAGPRLVPMREDTYTPSAETPLPVRSYEEDEAPRRSIVAIAFPWAGWAVAAGLAVGTVTLWHRTQTMQDQVAFANAKASRALTESAKAKAVMDILRDDKAQRFQLTKQSSQPIPSARVTYVADSGALILQGNNLDQLPQDKVYELWLIPAGEGRAPIPAGTFKPDERGYASLILPEVPKGLTASTFGVTMEEIGGSKTPTLPILMIGS